MMVRTELLVPMTEANQNFSKVSRLVDQEGMAVILKNNQPRYVVVDFGEFQRLDEAAQMRQQQIDETADEILAENLEAFLELAK